MRLVQPPVFARGLHGRSGFDGFAKGLNRHARRGAMCSSAAVEPAPSS
jgi:hypothetical protein